MKKRPAVSILELMFLLSVATVFLTMTGQLMQRAMKVQMRSRATAEVERSALRLSDQFRRDVHQARTAAAGDGTTDKPLVRLEFPTGRVVEYTRTDKALSRVETGADKPKWRDEYRFPASCNIVIEKLEASGQITLAITSDPEAALLNNGKPPHSTEFVPVSLYVVAVVGRDLQIGQAPSNAEENK